MTKTEIGTFTNRVTMASKTELIVIIYDIIENYIESAKQSMHAGDIESFKNNLRKAKQFINELNSSLDMQYNLSFELMSLYMFMNRCLVEAIIQGKSDKLDSVIGMVKKLRNAFSEVSKQDDSGSVMKNVQTVYAGLTYSKGNLNESFDTQYNRGFTC